MAISKTAVTRAPLHPLIAERWSPRGFDAVHQLDDTSLTALLEAARWAPSAGNSQPWRFLFSRRGAPAFRRLAGLLAPGNASWATAASALVLVAAETVDDTGRPRPWAVYDTGQAVAALSLQARADGLHVHQMGGFDVIGTLEAFAFPKSVTPLVVLAVGCLDATVELPEALAAREQAPRARRALESLLLEGGDTLAGPVRRPKRLAAHEAAPSPPGGPALGRPRHAAARTGLHPSK